MQVSGTLKTWKDDRGFGFIEPLHGGEEIFVHVSAFPSDGRRPVVGENLFYEIGRGRDGRAQAVKVSRKSGVASPAARRVGKPDPKSGVPVVRVILFVVLVAVAGSWGYRQFIASQQRQAVASEPIRVPGSPSATPSASSPVPAQSAFRCDGRMYCSQMSSCAEATWFLKNCPDTKMDGDGDGVPCEDQLCRAPMAK